MCYELCMQYEYIVVKCGCKDPRVVNKAKDSKRYCNDAGSLKCGQKISNNFHK